MPFSDHGHEPFEGGDLQIREFASKRLVHRVHNTGPCDGILCRIGPSLEHYVADLGRLVHP